jgi:hypothetical protein
MKGRHPGTAQSERPAARPRPANAEEFERRWLSGLFAAFGQKRRGVEDLLAQMTERRMLARVSSRSGTRA